MKAFDEIINEIKKDKKIPDSVRCKVEMTLDSLPKQSCKHQCKKEYRRRRMFSYLAAAIAVVIAVLVLIPKSTVHINNYSNSVDSDAYSQGHDVENSSVYKNLQEKEFNANPQIVINDVFLTGIPARTDTTQAEDFLFEYGIKFGDSLSDVETKVQKLDSDAKAVIDLYSYGYPRHQICDPLDCYSYDVAYKVIDSKSGFLHAFFEEVDGEPGGMIGLEYKLVFNSKDEMIANYNYYQELLLKQYGDTVPGTTSYYNRSPITTYLGEGEFLLLDGKYKIDPDCKDTISINNYSEWLIPIADGKAVKIELGTIEHYHSLKKEGVSLEEEGLPTEFTGYRCNIDYKIVSPDVSIIDKEEQW